MASRYTNSRRCSRRGFQIERLEDRLLMNADDSLANAVVLTTDDTATLSVDVFTTTGPPVAAVADLPERFQSAAEFEAWLIEAAVAQWGHLYGQRTHYLGWEWGNVIAFDTSQSIVARTLNVTNDFAVAGVASSTTNVQVEGVDEADLVETDGKYLYILSGQEFVIVEAGIGDDLRIASRVHLDEKPVGMYLSGDRLAIVSSSGGTGGFAASSGNLRILTIDDDYAPTIGPTTTTVTVLDVSDRAAPTMVQKTRMDGRLASSRVVDGELRIVLSNSISLPQPIARPVDGEATVSPIDGRLLMPPAAIDTSLSMIATDYWYPYPGTNYVYETKEEYLARVKEVILQSAMPGFEIFGLDGEVTEERALVDPTDVYRPEYYSGHFLTTIATFNMADNDSGPAATATVITGNSTQVYATADSLYLFSASSDEIGIGASWIGGIRSSTQSTRIHKFDFNPETNAIKFAARGSVEGTLLNQFAADEHDGFLRVVATQSWGGGQNVLVLKQMGKRLEVVGNIDDIAPSEQVYSVRFVGDRAFLVTFRVVDPLFAIDFSDPTDPRVMGELKIPGYSDYLQPIDEHHLLAIGRGADEATGLFQELQVSIFDVSDLTDPQLMHRYSFDGGRSITTPATGDRWQRGDGDHHAVSYFAEAGILALPIFAEANDWLWWEGDDGTPILEAGNGGLQIFQIDVAAGFTPLAIIEHETAVERSVQIGDHLWVISSGTVTVHQLDDPAIQLGELSLHPDDGPAPVELSMFEPQEAVTLFVMEEVTLRGDRGASRRPWTRIDFTALSAAGNRLHDRGLRPVSRLAHHAVFSSSNDLLQRSSRLRDVEEARDVAETHRGRRPVDEALEREGHRHRPWLGVDDALVGRLAEIVTGLEG